MGLLLRGVGGTARLLTSAQAWCVTNAPVGVTGIVIIIGCHHVVSPLTRKTNSGLLKALSPLSVKTPNL